MRLFGGVLAALALLLAAPAASARGARGAWSWNSAGTARGGQWQGFSPSWSPSSVLWLRADQGIILNGSQVSGWNDLSGNNNNATQATSANQLTYVTSGGANGQPYLQSTFDGANGTFLTGASPLVTTQPVEYFVVARTNGANPAAYVYLFNVSGTLNRCSTLQVINTHNIEQDNGTEANATTMTVNADFVVDSYFNGASSTLALNGGAPVGPANAGAASGFSGGYQISAANSANSWGGFIYEIVVVNRQVAVGDLTRLLYYFNARYNGL